MNKHSPFPEFLEKIPCLLGEGALIERLRRSKTCQLDPHLVNAAFIYDSHLREASEAICREYIEIGRDHDLPLLLSTPTWRANRERIAAAGYADRDVNGDNFRYLDALRKDFGTYAAKVIICGLLSCHGNSYAPQEALPINAAKALHSWQAEQLATAGVDFLLAATLPALSEAIGLAGAMARTGTPYMVSFVLRSAGTLLDGTPLTDAVTAIDASASPVPLAYLANCTHASNFRNALQHPTNSSSMVRRRFIGLLANTSALSPEDLDERSALVTEDPQVFGHSVASLYPDLGMKILGGCCGTDGRHIDALADQLTSLLSAPGNALKPETGDAPPDRV